MSTQLSSIDGRFEAGTLRSKMTAFVRSFYRFIYLGQLFVSTISVGALSHASQAYAPSHYLRTVEHRMQATAETVASRFRTQIISVRKSFHINRLLWYPNNQSKMSMVNWLTFLSRLQLTLDYFMMYDRVLIFISAIYFCIVGVMLRHRQRGSLMSYRFSDSIEAVINSNNITSVYRVHISFVSTSFRATHEKDKTPDNKIVFDKFFSWTDTGQIPQIWTHVYQLFLVCHTFTSLWFLLSRLSVDMSEGFAF